MSFVNFTNYIILPEKDKDVP